MSSARPPSDDELLRRLLSDEDSQEEEIAHVLEHLDAAGRYERSAIAHARGAAPAPGEDRVLATLQHLASPASPGAARPDRRRLGSRIAAAAALIAFALWLVKTAPQPPQEGPPRLLGPGEIVIESPIGPGADFSRFEWRGASPPGTTYLISVFPGDDDPLAAAIYVSPRITETSWHVPLETTRSWPDIIVWEITLYPPSGGASHGGSAEASR